MEADKQQGSIVLIKQNIDSQDYMRKGYLELPDYYLLLVLVRTLLSNQ